MPHSPVVFFSVDFPAIFFFFFFYNVSLPWRDFAVRFCQFYILVEIFLVLPEVPGFRLCELSTLNTLSYALMLVLSPVPDLGIRTAYTQAQREGC